MLLCFQALSTWQADCSVDCMADLRPQGATDMTYTFKLERDGQTITVLIRQMPHDTQYNVGDKMKYGSGKMWTVVAKVKV